MLRRLRAALPYLVAVWFAGQVGVQVSAWLLLPAGSKIEECRCTGHGAGRMCPMHRTAESKARCRLTSPDSSASAFSWVFGSIGVMPEESRAVAPLVFERAAARELAAPIQRSDIPESPPPRTLLRRA